MDTTNQLANGSYNLEYTLVAPSGNTETFILSGVNFNSGSSSFNVEASNITEIGQYDISFNIANTSSLNCTIETSFMVTSIPSMIALDLELDNNCNATLINVVVNAPTLSNGSYTITYDVTETNTNTVVTTNTINFTGGSANYQVDVEDLPQGNYIASIRSTQNDTTPCRNIFDFEERENFARQGVPDAPQAAAEQSFCLNNFPDNQPSLADINVAASDQILFYATENDMDILPIATILTHEEDYFVSNIDSSNGCESYNRTRIQIFLIDPPIPTSNDTNPVFCSEENPTLANLNVNAATNNSIVWFDAPENGNILGINTPLVDGLTYFAAAQNNEQCLGTTRLAFTPTVLFTAPPSLQRTNLVLCGLDNPTVVNLRAIENNTENEIFWYDQPQDGTPLIEETLLMEGSTYYAESFNANTGCRNLNRTPVSIDLTSCNPESYGFFIPDAFSPNGDGRNDTFYIPNIEVIYPDFTLEILNRYGSIMFKGNRNNPKWDGNNRSKIAPNGVYFYIIQYNKGQTAPTQGRLYLNR